MNGTLDANTIINRNNFLSTLATQQQTDISQISSYGRTNAIGNDYKFKSAAKLIGGMTLAFYIGSIQPQFFGKTMLQNLYTENGEKKNFAHLPVREQWLHNNKAALESVKKGLEDSYQGRVHYLGDFSQYLKNLVHDYFESRNNEGWDGYDAVPLTEVSKNTVLALIGLLPQGIKQTEIVPTPSGGFGFDWTEADKILSIDVENAEVSWSFINWETKQKQSGYELYKGNLPSGLKEVLIREFAV